MDQQSVHAALLDQVDDRKLVMIGDPAALWLVHLK
jgi:hypothetical protein